MPFEARKPLVILYKGRPLAKEHYPDLICYGQVIVEIKALRRLSDYETAQILNYLKASEMRVGLLINFGSHHRLEGERFVKEHLKTP